MANPAHVEILKKGVAHWNKWREETQEIEPDLYQANLSGVNLSEADLRKANLAGADLTKANLDSANLTGATLRKADLFWTCLTKAQLYSADLYRADLFGTNLSGANLSQVNLHRADLNRAILDGTDLSGANLSETHFSRVNLSQVKGLKTCHHSGPSFVDQSTLILSGILPEVFLKGCGFPDQFIDYLPSLLGSLNPIDFYSCFISYSVKDEKFAKQLHSDLQAAGIRCWYAPEDLKTGQKIRKEIHEAIRIHDKLLLVLSENSIDSGWVEEEVETALQQEASRKKNNQDDLVLFPIRLDDAVMDSQVAWAEKVRTRHIADFRKWKKQDSREQAFKRLLRDLQNESNNEKPKL